MSNRFPQFRTLVQIIDRSLDDARRRRLGLDKPPVVVTAPQCSPMINGKMKASRVDRSSELTRRTG